jgi:hypothetical protein
MIGAASRECLKKTTRDAMDPMGLAKNARKPVAALSSHNTTLM